MTQPPRRSLSSRQRTALALLLLGLTAGAGWTIGQRLQLSGDLRKFMPRPRRNTSALKRMPRARPIPVMPMIALQP